MSCAKFEKSIHSIYINKNGHIYLKLILDQALLAPDCPSMMERKIRRMKCGKPSAGCAEEEVVSENENYGVEDYSENERLKMNLKVFLIIERNISRSTLTTTRTTLFGLTVRKTQQSMLIFTNSTETVSECVLEKALTHCSQHASCKYPQSY
jgi:hypothetical protein